MGTEGMAVTSEDDILADLVKGCQKIVEMDVLSCFCCNAGGRLQEKRQRRSDS
jgi:hypothetical protein